MKQFVGIVEIIREAYPDKANHETVADGSKKAEQNCSERFWKSPNLGQKRQHHQTGDQQRRKTYRGKRIKCARIPVQKSSQAAIEHIDDQNVVDHVGRARERQSRPHSNK